MPEIIRNTYKIYRVYKNAYESNFFKAKQKWNEVYKQKHRNTSDVMQNLFPAPSYFM